MKTFLHLEKNGKLEHIRTLITQLPKGKVVSSSEWIYIADV